MTRSHEAISDNAGKVFRKQKPVSVLFRQPFSERSKSLLDFVPKGFKLTKNVTLKTLLKVD